jgi:hypothetical protein
MILQSYFVLLSVCAPLTMATSSNSLFTFVGPFPSSTPLSYSTPHDYLATTTLIDGPTTALTIGCAASVKYDYECDLGVGVSYAILGTTSLHAIIDKSPYYRMEWNCTHLASPTLVCFNSVSDGELTAPVTFTTTITEPGPFLYTATLTEYSAFLQPSGATRVRSDATSTTPAPGSSPVTSTAIADATSTVTEPGTGPEATGGADRVAMQQLALMAVLGVAVINVWYM